MPGSLRLLPAVFALLAPAACAAQTAAPAPTPLHNGQPFTAQGKLRIVYNGWKRYLVLPLDHPYLADFGPDEGTKCITALELNPQGDFALIADHAGEPLKATGTLQLEGISPYYWNGIMLMATAVTLPNGTALHPTRTQPRVPAETDLYLVSVAMVPHQFEWRREARDLLTGDLLPDAAVDGCSLNGAGDVINCLCTSGFTPVRAGVVARPLPTTRWRELPAATYALSGMAQLVLPNPDATRPQIVEVACKRTPPKAKGTPRR